MPQGDIFTDNMWLLEWVHLFNNCKPYVTICWCDEYMRYYSKVASIAYVLSKMTEKTKFLGIALD